MSTRIFTQLTLSLSLFLSFSFSTTHAQVLEYVGTVQDSLEGRIYYSTISSDGEHFYASTILNKTIVHYTRDTTTGLLSFVGKYYDNATSGNLLNNARIVVLSPDGRHAYVPAVSDDALSVFTRNTSTGALTFSTAYQDGVAGVDGLDGAIDMVFSQDGNFAYVVANADDAVSVFSRDSATGALTYLEVHKDGVAGVDGLNATEYLVMSNDGNHIYVSGRDDDAIAIFSRNSTTGLLTFINTFNFVSTALPGEVAISSDDNYLYMTSGGDSSIYVLSRNNTTGALTQVQRMLNDEVGTLVLLNGQIALAKNKPFVYATGSKGLSVFERDLNTGLLTFKQNEYNSSVFRGVSVSPDDKFIYASVATDTSLYIYQDTTVQLIVAIENIENEAAVEALHIFPNPAIDYINIQVSEALENKQVRIRLFSLNGQLLKESELTVQNGLLQLDLMNLPSGNYMLNAGKGSLLINKK